MAKHANINLATGTSRRTSSFQIATLIKVQPMVFAITVHAIAIQISLDHSVSWQHVKNAKILNDVRMSVVMPAHAIKGKCQCNAGRSGSDCSLVLSSTGRFKAISTLVHPVHGKACASSCRSECGSKLHKDKTQARSCVWSCENNCVSKGEHNKLKNSHEKLRSQF